MSDISAWLLSIVGIILITVVVEIVMPEGQINKYIKGVLAIFTVFIIVAPLPFLSIDNIDFNSLFGGDQDAQVDYDFVEKVNREKVLEYEHLIVSTLSGNGYKGVKVEITANVTKSDIIFVNIFVDLSGLVLDDKNLNINKYDKITAIICGLINVEKEKIMFYDGG